MAEESDLEKTEPASQRRLDDARAQGTIARSPELSAFAVTMSALAMMWFSSEALITGLRRIMARGLTLDLNVAREPAAMSERLYEAATSALTIGGPLLGVTVLAALLAPLAIGGFAFVPAAIVPRYSRIDPMAGLSRMFSLHGVTELGKALLKAGLIGGVGALVLWNAREPILALAAQRPDAAMSALAHLVMTSVLSIAAVMVVLALIDVPLQLWRHAKQLRMTREEVKREVRESDGDPHVRAAMRAMQREAAKKRMMADVPKADVIVTNPTHYAVALRYDETMSAPTVIAKGADLIAATIRGVAEQHRIPILEAAPLARALFHHTAIGAQIPEKLYTAVAEVLAYVFQLRAHGASRVAPLGEVEVPPELDPLAGAR